MLRYLWVGCLLVVLLAAACGGGKSVFSLEVGDCFDNSPGQAELMSEVEEVPCSESHDNEVYAVGDHPASSDVPYPGDDALDEYGIGYCLSVFDNYVGIDFEDSRLYIAFFLPTPYEWEEGDDREATCYLYDPNLAKLTGSMKGSRE